MFIKTSILTKIINKMSIKLFKDSEKKTLQKISGSFLYVLFIHEKKFLVITKKYSTFTVKTYCKLK